MAQIVIYARKSTESEDRQVMSIESQVKELREFADKQGHRISKVFTEAKSAKSPGRPVFNEMYKAVQKGKIRGILSWKLDRLARNPLDGGALIWALDQKQLDRIVTPTNEFTNTGMDKFWMQLEFGMAKKYIDDLSDNVRRGLRARIDAGWYPCRAPLGYQNDPGSHSITKDPERFPIVRRVWDHMLSGSYSVQELHRHVTKRWGLSTRETRRWGRYPISRSHVYRILTNPFYYGAFIYHGTLYPGKHPPMITKSEFDRVQSLVHRDNAPRPRRHRFTYVGLIRCGECGASITAQHTMNRFGSRYIYYHCAKSKPRVRCDQKAIEEKELERQIISFLETISISTQFRNWLLDALHIVLDEETMHDERVAKELERRHDTCKRELTELLNIKLRGLVSDAECLEKKQQLEVERASLKERLDNKSQLFADTMSRCTQAFDLAVKARHSFVNGDTESRRSVFVSVASNPVLRDKKLLTEPQKPFSLIQAVRKMEDDGIVTLKPGKLREPQSKKTGREAANLTKYGLVKVVKTLYRELLKDSGGCPQ